MADQRPRKGLVIFVSGPSGVGKSTVCRRLTTLLPAQFAPSATTRAGKKQDAYGKEYHFVDEAEFRRLIEARAFLEYAYIYGNWYGTLHQPVHDAIAEGRTIVLEIDVQGAHPGAQAISSLHGRFHPAAQHRGFGTPPARTRPR